MTTRQLICVISCIALLTDCSPAPDNKPNIAEDARNVLIKPKR
jgi:hypothetical protein